MRLIDIVNGPWAITPEMLLEIQGIYGRHLRGEKINLDKIEAAIGKPLANKQGEYQVENGVAIIPIEGVIAKKMNLFSRISGGASSEMVKRDFNTAMEDPTVKSIILVIDSPGGTVDGTAELADAIYNTRGQKPIAAITDGMMASAAYWIGSAADSLYITSDTTAVGSIGVVASHTDYSRREEQLGIKTTEITAGKYKRIASQYAPLSEEGRANIQASVDYLYSAFVNDVARNRGVSPEQVLNDMADGRLFFGNQAITAGLVDGVSTLDELIKNMSEKPEKTWKSRPAGVVEAKTLTEVIPMTKDELKAQHPDLYQAVLEEGKTEAATELQQSASAAREEGATAERERIRSIEEQAVPGHEALIAELKFDGKTTGPEAAVRILAAEKKIREQAISDMTGEAPPVVGSPDPGTGSAADTASLPLEERAKAAWEKSAELQAEFGGSFERYLAFEKASASGQAKIFGK